MTEVQALTRGCGGKAGLCGEVSAEDAKFGDRADGRENDREPADRKVSANGENSKKS